MNPDRQIVEVTEDDMGEQMMDPITEEELELMIEIAEKKKQWRDQRRKWRNK